MVVLTFLLGMTFAAGRITPNPPSAASASPTFSDGVGARAQTGPLAPVDFARLYERHRGVLWCAAAGVLGDRTLAQDVVQQAAVVGLERLATFDPETSFVAWMVQIVRNLALNESRKRARRATAPMDGSAMDATMISGRTSSHQRPAIDDRGQPTLASDAFDDELLAALNMLEETARGCLLMRVILDLPYRQIAMALNIPEGTAASHVHRARGLLRDALRGRGTMTWRPS